MIKLNTKIELCGTTWTVLDINTCEAHYDCKEYYIESQNDFLNVELFCDTELKQMNWKILLKKIRLR